MNELFITMEGVDGSGKSLQSKMLFDYLTENGYKTVLTREPGGTKISEKIREIIIDKSNSEMSFITEAFLYAAARAQLVKEIIRPALLEGSIVVCDRFLDSSIVYQGAARGLGVETVEIINSYATGGLKPHITFFFDIEPEIALKRKMIDTEFDRIEDQKIEFHNKVYNGYKTLANKYNERICIIDASLQPMEIFEIVVKKINSIIKGDSQ